MSVRINRRRFIGGAAALGGIAAGAALTGCDDTPATTGQPAVSGSRDPEPFYGPHQMGILSPSSAYGTALALNVTATGRDQLAELLTRISAVIEQATSAPAAGPTNLMAIPEDNGILLDTDGLLSSGTLAAGPSLFDDRFGLAGLKPAGLTAMPDGLARDALDPARTHGDLLVLLQGPERDITAHAVRRIVRETVALARVHWLLDVFVRPDGSAAPDVTSTRNLMGFKDGTANPDPTQSALMAETVWTAGTADGEPQWTTGGSYLVARTLRMHVEAWDSQTLDHQQKVFGRTKVSGAPLDGTKETDVPVYPADPAGAKIPFTAHIRLANPRDGKARLMLRRSMSYARGIDSAGMLDQGLFFVSYQRSMAAFLEAQARLKGEPLEQFVLAEGGGFYFAFPGPGDGEYVGQGLIEAS